MTRVDLKYRFSKLEAARNKCTNRPVIAFARVSHDAACLTLYFSSFKQLQVYQHAYINIPGIISIFGVVSRLNLKALRDETNNHKSHFNFKTNVAMKIELI